MEPKTPDISSGNPGAEKNHPVSSADNSRSPTSCPSPDKKDAIDASRDQQDFQNSSPTKVSSPVNNTSPNGGSRESLEDDAGGVSEDNYIDWDAMGSDLIATEPMKVISPSNVLSVQDTRTGFKEASQGVDIKSDVPAISLPGGSTSPSSPHALLPTAPFDVKQATDSDVASEDEEVIVEAGGVARRPPPGISSILSGQEIATHGTLAVKDDLLNPSKPSPFSKSKETDNSPENVTDAPPIRSSQTESLSKAVSANRDLLPQNPTFQDGSLTPSKARSDAPPNSKDSAGEVKTEGTEMREIVVTNSADLEMKGRAEFNLGYYIYNPSQLLPSFTERENGVFDVYVPAVFLSYENLKVRRRAIWGTDVYTDDSDVVAMAVHTGKYTPFPSPLSGNKAQPRVGTPDHDLKIRLRVLPKLLRYTGCTRHRIKTRDWGDHDGVSLRIENVTLIPLGAATETGRKNRKRRIDEHNMARKRIMAPPELDHMLYHYASGAVVKDESLVFHKQLDPCWKYTRPWQEQQKGSGKSIAT